MTHYERIVAALQSHGPMTVVQIAEETGQRYMSIQSAVRDLKRSGYIYALPPHAKTGIYDLTSKPNQVIQIQDHRRPETTVESAIRMQPKSVFEWRSHV